MQKTQVPLEILRQDPARHGWVLQDLLRWPQDSKHFAIERDGRWAYLHITGHPSSRGQHPSVMLDGPADLVTELFPHLPPAFLIRETDAIHLPALKARFPQGREFLERRMDVRRQNFREIDFPAVRRLTPDDAVSLARFHGAPDQSIPRFTAWLEGAAAVMGAFEDDALIAVGSTSFSMPEVWGLVGIATRPASRGQGYATQVTSALTKFALEQTELASLTVLSDNEPALRVYKKLGYESCQDRIWFDHGAGSNP